MMKKLFLLAIVSLLVLVAGAYAADCGNGIKTCACGDRVIADTTLTSNLICDSSSGYVNGLTVSNNVALTCASGVKIACSPGFLAGSSNCGIGVTFDAVSSSSLTGCAIEGWEQGVRVSTGSSNIRVNQNTLTNNLDGIYLKNIGNNVAILANTLSGNGVSLGNNEYGGSSIWAQITHGVANLEISGNEISNGYTAQGRGAISIMGDRGNATNVNINGNYIHDIPGLPAISITDMGLIGIAISGNRMINVGSGVGVAFVAPLSNGFMNQNEIVCSAAGSALGSIGILGAGKIDVSWSTITDCTVGIILWYAGLNPAGGPPDPAYYYYSANNRISTDFGIGICTDIAFGTVENNYFSDGVIGIANLLQSWGTGTTIGTNSYTNVVKKTCVVDSTLVGGCLAFPQNAKAGTLDLDTLCGSGEPPFICSIRFNFYVNGQLFNAPTGAVYVFKESEVQACGVNTADGIQSNEVNLIFGCQQIRSVEACNGLSGGTCTIRINDPGQERRVALALDASGEGTSPNYIGAVLFDRSSCSGQVNINAFTKETNCNDGLDNDNDGRADCQDDDCRSCPNCPQPTCTSLVTVLSGSGSPQAGALVLIFDAATISTIPGVNPSDGIDRSEWSSILSTAQNGPPLGMTGGCFGEQGPATTDANGQCSASLTSGNPNNAQVVITLTGDVMNPSDITSRTYSPFPCGGTITLQFTQAPPPCSESVTVLSGTGGPQAGAFVFTFDYATIATIPGVDPSNGIDREEFSIILSTAQNGPPTGMTGGCFGQEGPLTTDANGQCNAIFFGPSPYTAQIYIALTGDFMNPADFVSKTVSQFTCAGSVTLQMTPPCTDRVTVLNAIGSPQSGAYVLIFASATIDGISGVDPADGIDEAEITAIIASGAGGPPPGLTGGCFGQDGPMATDANGQCDALLVWGSPTDTQVIVAMLGGLSGQVQDVISRAYNPFPCQSAITLQFLPPPPEVCGDGKDNDRDHAIDDGTVHVLSWEFVTGAGSKPSVKKNPLPNVFVFFARDDELRSVGVTPKINSDFTMTDLVNLGNGMESGALQIKFFCVTQPGVNPGGQPIAECTADVDGGYQYTAIALKRFPEDPAFTINDIVARSVSAVNCGQYKEVHQVAFGKDASGNSKPMKGTQLTGTELWIYEPILVEWDTGTELYRFVFEAVADWGIEVAVAPPEGFVTDSTLLTDTVVDELSALQFTITDVGSKWEDTSVGYTIKHKGKTNKISSKVGVKVAPKYAKRKGLEIDKHGRVLGKGRATGAVVGFGAENNTAVAGIIAIVGILVITIVVVMQKRK